MNIHILGTLSLSVGCANVAVRVSLQGYIPNRLEHEYDPGVVSQDTAGSLYEEMQ